jgi:hypothetical protein
MATSQNGTPPTEGCRRPAFDTQKLWNLRPPSTPPSTPRDLDSQRQCKVADLMGLDRTTFWSDAVSLPLTGEHFLRRPGDQQFSFLYCPIFTSLRKKRHLARPSGRELAISYQLG